jgi:hypothetical protein
MKRFQKNPAGTHITDEYFERMILKRATQEPLVQLAVSNMTTSTMNANSSLQESLESEEVKKSNESPRKPAVRKQKEEIRHEHAAVETMSVTMNMYTTGKLPPKKAKPMLKSSMATSSDFSSTIRSYR